MELGKWKVLLFNRKRKNERLQDWLLAPVLFGDRATPHTWKPISFIPLFFVFVFMFAFEFVLFIMYWSKNYINFTYLWSRVFLGGVLPCFTLNFPTWFPPPHLMPPLPPLLLLSPFFPPPINNILWRRMDREEKETLAIFAFCYLQPVLTNNLLKVKRCSSISFSIRPQIVAPPMVNTQKETLQQSKQSKRLLNFPSIRRADRWH